MGPMDLDHGSAMDFPFLSLGALEKVRNFWGQSTMLSRKDSTRLDLKNLQVDYLDLQIIKKTAESEEVVAELLVETHTALDSHVASAAVMKIPVDQWILAGWFDRTLW